MMFSHHLHLVKRKLHFLFTALILILLFIVTWYHETDSTHTVRSSPGDVFPKPKSAFQIKSSFNGRTPRTNSSSSHLRHDSELPSYIGTENDNAVNEKGIVREEVPTTSTNDKSTLNLSEVESLGDINTKSHHADSVNFTISATGVKIPFIDLDKEAPPIHELYKMLTLVTSFSQNHFKEGLGFIQTAQKQMPNKTIIVYDLGLKKDALSKIRSFCNVQLRRFPFENYPRHVRTLHTYAFKPTIINLVLNEFGVIYYGDSSVRFKKPLVELLPHCVGHHGFLGQIRCFDPKVPRGAKHFCHHDYRLTKNEMYAKIGVNKTEYYNANFSSPALSGGLMLVVNSTTVQSMIMKPWLRCAWDVTCIAPRGANINNHRFDQSALSMIIFKNLRGEWTLKNDPTPHHNNVVSVMRGASGKWHPNVCY